MRVMVMVTAMVMWRCRVNIGEKIVKRLIDVIGSIVALVVFTPYDD